MKRPRSVTLLTLLVLMITSAYLIRFGVATQNRSFLLERALTLSPVYLIVTGAFWGVLGAAIVWGLWSGRAWAARLLRWVALPFSGYYWVEQMGFADPAFARVNWPFRLGMNLIVLGLVYGVLSRRNVRLYFGSDG